MNTFYLKNCMHMLKQKKISKKAFFWLLTATNSLIKFTTIIIRYRLQLIFSFIPSFFNPEAKSSTKNYCLKLFFRLTFYVNNKSIHVTDAFCFNFSINVHSRTREWCWNSNCRSIFVIDFFSFFMGLQQTQRRGGGGNAHTHRHTFTYVF